METNIEEALSLMSFVPISTTAFKRFLELEEAEHARNVESRLGGFKTLDGITISIDDEYYTVERGMKIERYVLSSRPNGIIQFSTLGKAQEFVEEMNFGTVKTDNVGVYRVRELKLRGYTERANEEYSKQNLTDGTAIVSIEQIKELSDSAWFSLMDKLDNIQP